MQHTEKRRFSVAHAPMAIIASMGIVAGGTHAAADPPGLNVQMLAAWVTDQKPEKKPEQEPDQGPKKELAETASQMTKRFKERLATTDGFRIRSTQTARFWIEDEDGEKVRDVSTMTVRIEGEMRPYELDLTFYPEFDVDGLDNGQPLLEMALSDGEVSERFWVPEKGKYVERESRAEEPEGGLAVDWLAITSLLADELGTSSCSIGEFTGSWVGEDALVGSSWSTERDDMADVAALPDGGVRIEREGYRSHGDDGSFGRRDNTFVFDEDGLMVKRVIDLLYERPSGTVARQVWEKEYEYDFELP